MSPVRGVRSSDLNAPSAKRRERFSRAESGRSCKSKETDTFDRFRDNLLNRISRFAQRISTGYNVSLGSTQSGAHSGDMRVFVCSYREQLWNPASWTSDDQDCLAARTLSSKFRVSVSIPSASYLYCNELCARQLLRLSCML